MSQTDQASERKLICPSCGRLVGPGPNGVSTVSDKGVEWCSNCACLRKINGRIYVRLPSPGRMVQGDQVDILEVWRDCYKMEPKHRIKVRDAKKEIQRAWDLWNEDKDATMTKLMFFFWLQRNRPYFLTFRCSGDPWQTVHSWILESDWDREEQA